MDRKNKNIHSFSGFGLVAAAVMLAGALLLPNTASAGLILRLDDGLGNSVEVSDGDSDGVVSYSGALGAIWGVNVTTGIGSPLVGGYGVHEIDLNSIQVTTGGAGTLTVSLTQTDLSVYGPVRYANMSIGGTTDGTVTYSAFVDDTNAAFGEGEALGVLGPFSGGADHAFSGVWSGLANTPNTYSMTQVATITHTAAMQNSSFNAVLKVPEPTSLALFGMGLLGLGVAFRRRRAAA